MLSSRPIHLPSDGTLMSTKTPGRGLKTRAENAYAGAGGPITVAGKSLGPGKNINVNALPKTPFQKSSAQPQTGKQRILLTTGRPLGDKTPLPNRFGHALFQTPLPGLSKLGSGVEAGNTPDSLQRPSSMRKHIKQPRNSVGKVFETPVNNGNHWDTSDGDIVLAAAQQPETIVEDAGDDMDEVEYGPPNTLDLPYQPPIDFELPNYKEVGKMLFQFAHSARYDEASVLDFEVAQLDNPVWDTLPLSELESDDPFYLARLETSAPAPAKGAKATTHAKMVLTTRVPLPATVKPALKLATSRLPPSASSQSHKTSATSVATTRSNSVASTRVPARRPVISSRPPSSNSAAASATAKKTLASRPGLSGTTTTAGARSSSNRVVELRRPHTSIAIVTEKTKAQPTDVIVFDDVVLDDESDFLFAV